MARLFISHSSTNNAEAVAVRDWLAAEGWDDVFLDLDPARGIAAGERWERALNEAASRCQAVLFLVSRAWLASRWCLKEFHLARKLNKRLLAVLIEPIPVGELPADLTGAWQVVDLASGQDHRMLRVVLPGTHEEAHVTFSREGLTRLRNGLAKAGLDPRFFAWPPEHDRGRAPYRGLKPLEAGDAGIFFGRDAPIVEALDTLRGLADAAAPRLLVLLGASGAGKSSFLRAGLLPRLARDDRHFLPLPVIRPERAAISGEAGLIRAIETTLAAHGIAQMRASIRYAVTDGAESLRPLLGQLVDTASAATLADATDAKRPLIVISIDQAEELFLGEGAGEGRQLLELLRDLVSEDRPGVIVLIAIRSDSYDRLETAKELEGMRQQALPLLPMPRGAYQTVIEGPAARLNETDRRLAIEPRLTQRLLEDIERGGGSDALPLLAFTLEQLFLDYGAGGALKLANYEAFGGIRGAIEAAVERALVAADNDPRIPRDRDARLNLLRRGLIPWLAGIDPETQSPRRRIARLTEIPAEAEPLIRLLVEQRLLTIDRIAVHDGAAERAEITIEPAHEALLRQWGLLDGWLKEDFGALTTLEGVKRAARDWAANARHADWLNHSGSRLDDAEKVATRDDLAGDLGADARDYLVACRARDQTEQRERIERLERERAEQARQVRDAQALAAANRRTARRTGLGLVAALMLAALAGWQWKQAQTQTRLAELAATDAKAQRDRAEHALSLATDTANGLIFDLAQKFRDAGLPAPLVKDILDRARKLQDQLFSAGESSLNLRGGQTAGLIEYGRTLLVLGDTNGALAAVRQALSILQGMLATAPDSTDVQQRLSIVDDEIGDVLKAQGKLDEALAAYRDGLAIRKALAALDPSNTGWQRDLSVSDNKIGDVLKAQGKLDEALAAHRDSLAIGKALAARDPSNTQWQRDLSIRDAKIGDVLVAQGRLDEALAAYGDALVIFKTLAARDPSNTQWQSDLALCDERIGGVLVAQGKLDEALAAYRDGLAIGKALAALDPSNTQWQRYLLLSDESIGDVLVAQGKLDEALAAYRDGLTIGKALAALDPSNTEWQRDLSISDERIGDVLKAEGKLDEALAAYRDSLAIRKALAAQDPGNMQWLHDVSLSEGRVGDVLEAQGKLDEAVAAYRHSLAIDKVLATRDPSNTAWQRDLSISDNRIGDALKAQGKLDEALAAYRDGLTIRKALVARDPSNAQWQKDLQVSIEHIGDTTYRMVLAGDSATALGAADEAIALAPDQIWLYTNRAHALMFLGRADEARALYLKYRGEKNVQDEKSWEAVVLEDFAELRKAGLANPLMDEIEKLFAGRT